MTPGKRVTGFVVGSDPKGTDKVWKVRVKDQASVHDGKKFEVAFLHPGNEPFGPSTDVTFRIEPLQVEGEFVLKATDVATGPVQESGRQPEREVAAGMDTLSVCAAVTISTGEVYVFTTGYEDIEEARRYIDCDGFDQVVAFKAIDLAPPHLEDGVHTGLEIVERLSVIDGPRDALDYLLSEVFKLGQASSKS